MMKMHHYLRLLWIGLLSLQGCATGSGSPFERMDEGDSEEVVQPGGGQLDDLLARQAGVRVDGRGPGARIHVSGGDFPNPPLFVIDGVAIGHEFQDVWWMVTSNDVERIRVIRASSTEAVVWGFRGGNGVIEIVTKRGE